MTQRLNCEWTKLENHPVTVIDLSGQIDSGKALEEIEEIATASDAQHVAIQMENVTYLNSSGCAGLIALHQKVKDRGFHMFLIKPVKGVAKVIQYVAGHKILPLRESLEEIINEVEG